MKLKKFLPIFLVLFISGLIRLLTLNKLMVFTPDESYLLYIAQTLAKDFHIIWIGVSALGFDYYMGPGWIYFIYPFVAMAKGDPLVIGIISSLIGVVTCFVIYWFGRKLFNQKVGILSAVVYAFSALIVYYDQQPYPTGVPLLSLGILISIYMTKYSQKWWILFAVLYGVVFHIHLSLVLLVFVGLYWALTHKKVLDKKTILISFAAFVLTISPLIMFDYFHKWSNITAPIRVLQAVGKSTTKFDLGYRLNSLGKSISRLWYLDLGKSNTDEVLYPCNAYPGNNSTKANWLIVAVSAVIIILFILKGDVWKNEGKRLLLLSSLAFVIPFVFLPSIGSVEYYLLGFYPILILMIASTIESFSKPIKNIFYFLIVIFVVYNSHVVFKASGDFGLQTKKVMVEKVMNTIGDSSFDLTEKGGTCQGAAGWRYIFLAYGRRPARSSEDKVFSWLWPDEIKNENTKYSVIIEETRFSKNEKDNYSFKFIEGGFTTYIYEN